jgi:hypothetical protein
LLRKADWRELTIPYSFFTEYTTTTGTYTTTALTITGIPSTAGLDTTYMVVGTGIPNATFITSVDSGTQVTVSAYSTSAVTAGTIYFQKVKYALPSDYDSIVPRTQWDKSKHWEMLGPERPAVGMAAQRLYQHRPAYPLALAGAYFQIWPGYSDNENLGFEYRSKGWALSAAMARSRTASRLTLIPAFTLTALWSCPRS